MSGQLLTGASHQPIVIGMICFLMAIGSMLRPRWLPQKSFPPYAYLPGREPHPVRDPRGHSLDDGQTLAAHPRSRWRNWDHRNAAFGSSQLLAGTTKAVRGAQLWASPLRFSELMDEHAVS